MSFTTYSITKRFVTSFIISERLDVINNVGNFPNCALIQVSNS